MAMSAGPATEDDSVMSDINTTPLVDIMLVLLIIFLITVPVVIQSVPLQLPKVRHIPTQTKPENVNLSVKATNGQCQVYWGQQEVGSAELVQRATDKLRHDVAAGFTGDDLPEAHIRGDVATPYKCIGGVIFNMQRVGYAKVGFISEPPPHGG